MNSKNLHHSPLGKKSTYLSHYQANLLFPIPRKNKRKEIGVDHTLPFQGNDIWNAYELSWLNSKGKPIVAGAEFTIPCESPNLIESKSFKLYLNSYNNTLFDSFAAVENFLTRDLTAAAGAPVAIKLIPLKKASQVINQHFVGICLDELDISCDTYSLNPEYLILEDSLITETLYSDLLKSNCLITGQPDWGSILISYTGKKIQSEGLLKYIISFRNHNEFHEQCVERIFIDIMRFCAPQKLLVYARYTRRGGLDINPYRANYDVTLENIRLWRQ
ncbi:MAG: NADPH-dependent 7-cyano-7-deazaguanine reductase QueF [Gammaproteobacteria bacterium RIFCSPHIGHO2_12_FULL_37_14]|nr:MAG: NADPH-dependent 7-cyano-7-deazaguanine reductase QueF [Gammaproteobacteria bacterium RIFCSPHIGHO2_12_FULL_37_14]